MSTGTQKQKLSSIGDLPNELLTIVFELVHQSQKETSHLYSSDDPYGRYWFSNESLTSPARFPNSLAHVCLKWRAAMSSVPAFWTDIVIIVDALSPVPFSLSDVQSMLEWSFDLPLNIAITRRQNSRPPDSFDERTILAPLINLLSSQLYRCRSFAFYTFHSSALPLLGRDIHGSAPLLRELKLECQFDDRVLDDVHHGWRNLSCPSFLDLSLNGANLINITRQDPNWLINLPDLVWVAVSRLAPPGENDISRAHLSFSKFFEMLASDNLELEYLRISDFDPGYYDMNPPEEGIPLEIINQLVLEDLSDAFVHEFSRTIQLYADELHISRCSLNSIGDIPFTETLTLEDISPADDLSICLRKWPGSVLTLSGCPSFDDHVLNMMGDPDVLRDFDNSPNSLVRLTIVNCPNFTVEGLKEMVEGRNEEVEDVLRYYGPPAIEGIRVSGEGPSLSSEDVEWFKDRLRYLTWHTTQRGGTASIVEFDAEDSVVLDFD